MLNPKVKVYIECAWRIAQESLAKVGKVEMLTLLVNIKDNKIHFVPPTPLSKNAYAALIKATAETLPGIDLAIMLSEAWLVKIEKDDPDREKFLSVTPSESNKRIEVVIVAFKLAEGTAGQETRELKRDKKIVYLSKEIDKSESISSRFLDGIFSPNYLH